MEQLNSLENSVPQQEVEKSTNEKAGEKKRHTNMSAESEDSPRDNGSPPPQKKG